MKKHLLIAVCFGMYLNASAQNQASKEYDNNSQLNSIDNPTSAGFHPTITKPVIINSGDRAITKTKIASSWNALTLLVSASNCLTANQATGSIMFTHRINKDWAAPSANSGFIQSTFSFDGGTTWDSLLHMQEQDPNRGRYPSGAIFNPTSNTTPGNAFGVVSGPITDGGTPGWKGNFFASTQLNKTNNNLNIRLNATGGVPYQHFARIGIQSTDTKVIVTGGIYNNDPTVAGVIFRGAMLNYATPSGSNFTWTVDSIKPNFRVKSLDGTNYSSTQPISAWSKDGMTGYLVFLAIDNAATGNNQTYQPLVWKTTNGGTNWSQLPLFDFASLPSVAPNLRTVNVGTTKKAFYSSANGMDALVDINGNLHILSTIMSASSVHPDSLDYRWNVSQNLDGAYIDYIYDTYTTGSTWNALLIDSLRCFPANVSSPFSGGSPPTQYGVDARLQMSASTDGSRLFYMWMDSDFTAINGENALPDIFGKGWNISTGLLTPTTQFTYDGNNYYMYTSNVALVNGSTYTIPTTVSLSRDGSNVVDNPFDHYYVSGIQFNDSDFTVGINEISENGNLVISQNYPNPFNKSTSIDVTLKENSSVSIQVFNAIGQNVFTQNSEKLNAGTHTFNIDGSKLTNGVYFYTVKTNKASITRKMIVQ